MSILAVLHLIWHLLLAVVNAVVAGVLFSRYLQLKMADKRSGLSFWWALGLTVLAIYSFWLIVWDFPEFFQIEPATAKATMTISRFVLIPLGLFCFLLPTLKMVVRTALFGPLLSIFITLVFTFTVLLFLRWGNSAIFDQIEPLSIYSFGFLAPAELFLAFLFLFLFSTMVGPYFWKVRAVGFVMIAFAFLTLAAMNASRYFMVEVAAPFEAARPLALPSLAFIMQISREAGYFLVTAGFYLATMPRVLRRSGQ